MSQVAVVVSDEGLGGVVPFGRALQAAGQTPLLLTGQVSAAQLAAWRAVYAEVHVLEDPYDAQVLAGQALRLAGGRPLAALFSCYDGLVMPAAQAAASLGLPHPALAGLARSRNKYASRLATRQQGLPTPRFHLATSAEACARAAEIVGFPAVIKPLNGMASHLVQWVDSRAALQAAYQALVDRVGRSFSGNYSRPVSGGDVADSAPAYDPRTAFLVEQFLEGVEYSAEVIVRDDQVHRIALFHKFLVDRRRGFLECGFTRPGLGVSAEREPAIWRCIEDCLTALQVEQAAAHVEIMDTADGPFLVEVNAGRAGGQILVLAVREATGVDLIAEIVALQCGWPRPATSAPALQGRVTTLTIFPPTSGRLNRLEGLEKAARLPGVLAVIPFCQPGDLLDVQDKEFFAVNLLVAGVAGDALYELYRDACRLVQFAITPLADQPEKGIKP